MRLCCIFNIPSLYREAIYLSLDHNYNCDWYFEQMNKEGIAIFDTSKLKSVHFLNHKKVVGRFYRMQGLSRQIWKHKEIDGYLMIGSPMCLSLWLLCILVKIFRPQKKIYFWTHGWYGKETRLERLVKKAFLKLADELFIYGDYATNLLIKEGFKKEKLHAIHNSLSYNEQLSIRKQIETSSIYYDHFGNNQPVIIFIGRLTPVKKLDMILDALDCLNKRGLRYNLVFVGDGPEKGHLIKKVDDYQLNSQVWFYGACYDEKTNAELVYNADLCVAPGNIGLTAIHVLMFGCPAITHNDFAHQMPEFEAIHPGITGNFFKRDSVNSLVETIATWLQNDTRSRAEIRNNCYREIDELWNPCYQMKIFNQVLNNANNITN